LVEAIQDRCNASPSQARRESFEATCRHFKRSSFEIGFEDIANAWFDDIVFFPCKLQEEIKIPLFQFKLRQQLMAKKINKHQDRHLTLLQIDKTAC